MSKKIDKLQICMLSIISTNIDVWESDNIVDLLNNYAQNRKYNKPEQINKSLYEIQIDELRKLYISRYGILILSEVFELDNSMTPIEILKWKEEKNDENKNDENSKPHEILREYTDFFNPHINKKGVFSDKVHYTLVCYLPSAQLFESYEIQKACLWLMLKTEPDDCDIKTNIVETLNNKGAEYIKINENNKFFTIWGARMILSTNNISEALNDYIRIEAANQSLWLLVSAMNNYIDECIASDNPRSKQLFEIIDRVYDVMFYEAEFNYINARTSHRFQLEIQKCLYKVSNLGTMVGYFKEKADLLEHKVSMISEKEEKESSDNLNFILNVLTIVSSASAIFQIVDYCVNSPQTIVPSILANIIIIIPLIVVILIKAILRKKDKK